MLSVHNFGPIKIRHLHQFDKALVQQLLLSHWLVAVLDPSLLEVLPFLDFLFDRLLLLLTKLHRKPPSFLKHLFFAFQSVTIHWQLHNSWGSRQSQRLLLQIRPFPRDRELFVLFWFFGWLKWHQGWTCRCVRELQSRLLPGSLHLWQRLI